MKPLGSYRALLQVLLLSGLLLAVMAACSAPTKQEPESDPVESNLYMSLGGGASGLYKVDTETGRAGRISTPGSFFAANSMGGLAPGAQPGTLFGIEGLPLYLIELGDMSAQHLGNDINGWGLAYDPQEGEVYAAGNGYLTVRSPETGAVLRQLVTPPTAMQIYALAFDPETRTLYGLVRHVDAQPQFNDIFMQLYELDVDAHAPAWQEAGSTGQLWTNNAGLAFDLEQRVLYAIGNSDDPGALFKIDPETGAATKVGETGLTVAGGGLAWMSEAAQINANP